MGGGGGNSPAPRPKPKPKTPKKSKRTPVKKPKNQYAGGDAGTTKPTTPTTPTTPNTMVEGGSGTGAPMSFIGDASTPDRSETTFVPGAGEGVKDSLEQVLGGAATQFFGTSPFARDGAGRGQGFLASRFREADTDVGLDAAVEAQEFAPEVGGGDIGVGSQGFGSRALIGGEAETVMPEGNESNAVNTETPAEVAPSDVAMDPEYQIPGPGKQYMNDFNFSIPFMRNPNVIAFLRNSRNARRFAKGPMSRGLMSARSGFGRRFG